MPRKKSLSRQIIDILKQSGQGAVPPDLLRNIDGVLREHLKREKREAELHKRLNAGMLNGLHNIYREIAEISRDKPGGRPQNAGEAGALFHEVSRQFDEIMTTTYNAADNIMNLAERIQDNQARMRNRLNELRAAGKLEQSDFELLDKAGRENAEAVNSIVTALSFQDLTGQRIKKVVSALGSVHSIVAETYIFAGLMLKKAGKEREKDFAAIEEESRKRAANALRESELKGPVLDSAQKDVDDLLAQLGL